MEVARLVWETTNEVGDGEKSGDLLLLLMTRETEGGREEDMSTVPQELVLITVSSAWQKSLSELTDLQGQKVSPHWSG